MTAKQIAQYIIRSMFLFFVGAIIYPEIEILYRGYTHWSMGILGGVCFIICGCLNDVFGWDMPLWKQQLIASVIITGLEFMTGVVVNIILGWNVWDYSNLPFNILGQICLPFMVIWFFLSLVGIVVDDFLRWSLFDGEKPRYRLC